MIGQNFCLLLLNTQQERVLLFKKIKKIKNITKISSKIHGNELDLLCKPHNGAGARKLRDFLPGYNCQYEQHNRSLNIMIQVNNGAELAINWDCSTENEAVSEHGESQGRVSPYLKFHSMNIIEINFKFELPSGNQHSALREQHLTVEQSDISDCSFGDTVTHGRQTAIHLVLVKLGHKGESQLEFYF